MIKMSRETFEKIWDDQDYWKDWWYEDAIIQIGPRKITDLDDMDPITILAISDHEAVVCISGGIAGKNSKMLMEFEKFISSHPKFVPLAENKFTVDIGIMTVDEFKRICSTNGWKIVK